jgi:hypothetical protein
MTGRCRDPPARIVEPALHLFDRETSVPGNREFKRWDVTVQGISVLIGLGMEWIVFFGDPRSPQRLGDRQFLNSCGANSRCAVRGLKKLIAEAPKMPRIAEKGSKRS